MKLRNRRILTLCIALAGLVLLTPGSARADCPNPDVPGGQSPEGVIVYNGAYNVLQYCDGDQWIALGAVNPSAGDGTCANPEGVEGEMFYNNAYKAFQFCNGEDWIAMAGYGSGAGSCPSGIAFLDTFAAPSTLVTSNIEAITNITVPANVTISGEGNPEYRICDVSDCSSELQTWGATAGVVSNGDYVQLRLTSHTTAGQVHTATVSIGLAVVDWSVTSAPMLVPGDTALEIAHAGTGVQVRCKNWTGNTCDSPQILVEESWAGCASYGGNNVWHDMEANSNLDTCSLFCYYAANSDNTCVSHGAGTSLSTHDIESTGGSSCSTTRSDVVGGPGNPVPGRSMKIESGVSEGALAVQCNW